jgi:FAD/FMN-containing dehydrogenase
MSRIKRIDAVNRFAVVEPGLINVRLTEAVEPLGLHYAPDPSSQTACTLGGNVAENSGGPHCFKHGATTRHVLGLVIVTADGEILDLSEPVVDPDGLDLVGLFVGCEGMFGLATEVTVRLSKKPPVTETLLAIFATLGGARRYRRAPDHIADPFRAGILGLRGRRKIRRRTHRSLRAPPHRQQRARSGGVGGGGWRIDARLFLSCCARSEGGTAAGRACRRRTTGPASAPADSGRAPVGTEGPCLHRFRGAAAACCVQPAGSRR